MVRAGIILAGLISLAPGFCEAADKNPSHPVWRVENLPDSLPTVASNFTVYEVRANDLRFVIEYSSDDGGMKIRDTPKPFFESWDGQTLSTSLDRLLSRTPASDSRWPA